MCCDPNQRPAGWRGLLLATFVLGGLFAGFGSDTVAAASADPVAVAEETLQAIDAELGKKSRKQLTEARLKSYQSQLAGVRSTGNACQEEAKEVLQRIEGELAILSPEQAAEKAADAPSEAGAEKSEAAKEKAATAAAGSQESQEIAELRRKLEGDRDNVNARLTNCRLLLFKTQELSNRINVIQQEILASRLKVHGPNFWEVVGNAIADVDRWWEVTTKLVVVDSGFQALGSYHTAALGMATLVGLGIGLLVRRGLRRAAAGAPAASPDVAGGFGFAALACGARYAPWLGASLGAAAYVTVLWQLSGKVPFLTELFYGLVIYLAVVAVIRASLHPCRPAEHYLELPEDVSVALARRLQVLALMVLVGFLFVGTAIEEHLPEWLQLFAQDVYIAFLVLNLIWVLWLVGRFQRWRHDWKLRLIITLAAVAALAAEWLGYRAFSQFLIIGVVLTLPALGLGVLVTKLAGELFDGLDEGRYAWQRSLRRRVGVVPGEPMPGSGWMNLLATLFLWSGVGAVLLKIWGVSEQGFAIVGGYLTEGFSIAGFNIVPSKIALAILVLALLLNLTRWLRGWLNHRWLVKFRMDQGAREALVTTSGYLGATVAVLLALGVAGIELTNLAIIAGALSVGIGFGLQNIVNNFISGLILLFERPVKKGDFIVVGGTQGYVKRISIRTTQIQTQDKADIILPNSELISAQVTNWMLNDPLGRIIVPVGVAYGSDTARVRDILLRIANEHPDVIKDRPSVPQPRVLFRAFGDSSLMFELRAFVRQIDRQFDVISDINFAVDAAFREQGIEIPFPQRDLHVRSVVGPGLPQG